MGMIDRLVGRMKKGTEMDLRDFRHNLSFFRLNGDDIDHLIREMRRSGKIDLKKDGHKVKVIVR